MIRQPNKRELRVIRQDRLDPDKYLVESNQGGINLINKATGKVDYWLRIGK